MGKPLTLTISAYKQLRVIVNTINSITDLVAMGDDIKQAMLISLLVKLIEQTSNTLDQIERDSTNDTITHRSSHGRNEHTSRELVKRGL